MSITSPGVGWWQASDGNWYPPSATPGVNPPPPPDPVIAASAAITAADATTAGAWLVIAGGALMAVGTLLPWIMASSAFGSISRNGFQLGTGNAMTFDGPLTLVTGIVTVVIGILRLTRSAMPRRMQRSSIVTGVIVGLILANRWSGLHDLVNQVNGSNTVTASIGYGYWMCGVGALVAVCGGIALRSATVGKP